MRFPDNARVCFIGDSLTAMNETLPRIIDFYRKNFPTSNIRFFNCGTSGGTYKTAIEFFFDDVLRHKPTHAVVAFGVNDSNRWALNGARSMERLDSLKKSFEEYKTNVKRYCEMLKNNSVQITLCTPAPYDEYTESEQPASKGGYALILGYAQFVRDFAQKNGIPLCDYHEYMTKMIQSDPEKIYSPDHVHPTSHGYYLMAKCFLSYQGYEIGNEIPLPDYFKSWREAVARLRLIYGAEQMIIRNYHMPTEEKITIIKKKVEQKDWGQPVFEPYIRVFALEKNTQDALYEEIDALYEQDILMQ